MKMLWPLLSFHKKIWLMREVARSCEIIETVTIGKICASVVEVCGQIKGLQSARS